MPELCDVRRHGEKGDDIGRVRETLIKTVEEAFKSQPADETEVKLSLAEAATDYERTLSDPESFAVDLSDYIALGDWRLFSMTAT